jgi:hypothetical protein
MVFSVWCAWIAVSPNVRTGGIGVFYAVHAEVILVE